MKKSKIITLVFAGAALAINACKKSTTNNGTSAVKDKLVVVTSISNGTAAVSYLGALKDLNIGSYTQY